MFSFLKNAFLNRNRYRTHSEAVVISCFYNPQNNPYRLLAFQKWYHSIKHLNHRIIECLIGPDAKSQLPASPYITQVRTDSLLWHKETLLNKIVVDLPEEFKYVFWVDADVLFTNKNWLVDGVAQFKAGARILQPFEYCVHLERNRLEPDFDMDEARQTASMTNKELGGEKRLWRSFCANYVKDRYEGNFTAIHSTDYDVHGHVGFAWGATKELLLQCPLFERALIGGADHIIAHAAAGQLHSPCISKGFSDNLVEVERWVDRFSRFVRGQIGFVTGDLYHIWHGDIKNRQYLKRIKDFTGKTKEIVDRDANGLYVGKDRYVRRYYRDREVTDIYYDDFGDFGYGFAEDMGYLISDVFNLFGPPAYAEEPDEIDPGIPDDQPNDFVPFDQGGAGVPDNNPMPADNPELENAIFSESNYSDDETPAPAADIADVSVNENYS